MLSIQSVGLGYSKPAAGLMERPPLPPGRPILTRGLIAWLAFAGLLMAVGTLSVISWADQARGLALARTMGMVTFALFIPFFSIESKDERDSAFSLDTFSDKTFVITTSGSFVLLHPVHRPEHLPDRAEDRPARRPAVADLHRLRPADRGGRRIRKAVLRRSARRGDAGQPVT